MNETLLSHYLSGRRPAPADLFGRIADILGVAVDDITPRAEQAA